MIYDCIIIGAGPAGLTAALYLARFRRNIMLIHNNESRAALIPTSHNLPGYKNGIAGKEFLQRVLDQLMPYQVPITLDTVTKLHYAKKQDQFSVITKSKKFVCKKLILATGVIDIEPNLPNVEHAIKKGLLRHCPICDGYEVIDNKMGIICRESKAVKEALFLQNYSEDITLFTLGKKVLLPRSFPKSIKVVSDKIIDIYIHENKITRLLTKKHVYEFDTLYSALGSVMRCKIASDIGAKTSKDNSIVVNAKQETNIKGLYAIGDITPALNQIAVAMGQAAIAATNIHAKL